MSGSLAFSAKQRLLIAFSAFVLICGGFVGSAPRASAAAPIIPGASVGCVVGDEASAASELLVVTIAASATNVILSRSATKIVVSNVANCSSYTASDIGSIVIVPVSGTSSNTVTVVHSTRWDEAFSFQLGGEAGDKVVYLGTEGDDLMRLDSVLLRSKKGGELRGFGSEVMKLEIKGGAGADVLIGGGANAGTRANSGTLKLDLSTLYGEAGSDILVGGPGPDTFNGGTGYDVISYNDDLYPDAASEAISFTFASTTAQGTGGAGEDTCSASCTVEAVEGSSYADDLTAKAAGSILYGAAGDDTLTGGAGADVLLGGDDEDDLTGAAGNDTLVGGDGDDTYVGGAGIDTISFDDDAYTEDEVGATGITFTLVEDAAAQTTGAGDDTCDTLCDVENLTGGSGDDTLTGNASANVIQGLDGTDLLDGDKGNDILVGGFGDDTFTGGSGTDAVSYDDITYPGASDGTGVEFSLADDDGQNTGGADYDILAFPDGKRDVEDLTGSSGDDILEGDLLGNRIDGREGVDQVSYAGSNAAVTVSLAGATSAGGHAAGDVLTNIEGVIGSIYGDTLTGGASNDTLTGGAGADTLAGGAGTDTLEGGTGDDSLDGGAGADALTGGDGTDKLSFASSTVGITVTITGTTITATGTDATGDTYSSLEAIVGSNLADRITGDAAANNLSGGGGNDVIIGGGGADVLSGGDGTDTVSYAGTTGAVQVNLSTGVVTGAAGDDSISSFEVVVGTSSGDTLIGSAGADTLRGGGGNDLIQGGSAADRLVGGAGNDRLVGGSGADTLVGGAGDDRLDGGPDTDTCRPGTGTNTLRSCP